MGTYPLYAFTSNRRCRTQPRNSVNLSDSLQDCWIQSSLIITTELAGEAVQPLDAHG